jgi:hypothetical protein
LGVGNHRCRKATIFRIGEMASVGSTDTYNLLPTDTKNYFYSSGYQIVVTRFFHYTNCCHSCVSNSILILRDKVQLYVWMSPYSNILVSTEFSFHRNAG